MAHTRLAHGLARRPGRSGFGGLAGLSHLTRQQMEGQLVAGWPRMVERPRESASRTTSVRGLISPGPDRRVPESITRPSPRPVAWGLLPSDEPARHGQEGRPTTRGDTGQPRPPVGWACPRGVLHDRHGYVVSRRVSRGPADHVQNSAEEAQSRSRTQAGGPRHPRLRTVRRRGFRRCVGEGARDNIYLLTRRIPGSYSSMGRTVPAQRMLAEGAISQSILSKC